jgi:hypothetical protein
MKFLVATFLTALLAFAAGLFFPWWAIAITSFIVAVAIHQNGLAAFLSGFLGLALLWGITAVLIDFMNNHLLATKIASVLPLGGSVVLLILVTAFVGGLVGGFAAMTGSFLRGPVRKIRKYETTDEAVVA